MDSEPRVEVVYNSLDTTHLHQIRFPEDSYVSQDSQTITVEEPSDLIRYRTILEMVGDGGLSRKVHVVEPQATYLWLRRQEEALLHHSQQKPT